MLGLPRHTCGVPEERLSPCRLPTPCCSAGHLAFLLCIFLINSLSQRENLWRAAAYFGHFWGVDVSTALTQRWKVLVQTSILIYPAAHGAVRRDFRCSRNCSWHHNDQWLVSDPLSLTSLPFCLKPASKLSWSVGSYSRNPKHPQWVTLFTLVLVSRAAQE